MTNTESITELAAAVSAAQAEMPVVAFDATNPFLKNKYASLGAVIQTSRPILAKHGLSISQLPTSEGELIGVRTVLSHKSGQFIEDRILIHPGEEKGKSSAQVAGSILTYLRRYSWAAVLGIYADEDTDGELPQRPSPAPRQAPVPRPAPAAQTPAPPARTASAESSEPPEARLARFLNACKTAGGDEGQLAASLFIEMGWLLENETIDALSINRVPKTQKEVENIVAEIHARADEIPGAEVPARPAPAVRPAPARRPAPAPETPTIPEGAIEHQGFVKMVSKKAAGTKGGFRYGICIVQDMQDRQGGEWINTFSDTDGALAESYKGQWIALFYVEGQYGKDLVHHSISIPA